MYRLNPIETQLVPPFARATLFVHRFVFHLYEFQLFKGLMIVEGLEAKQGQCALHMLDRFPRIAKWGLFLPNFLSRHIYSMLLWFHDGP